MTNTIDIVSAPTRHLAVKKFSVATIADMGSLMGQAFGAVAQYAGEHGIPIDGPAVEVATVDCWPLQPVAVGSNR